MAFFYSILADCTVAIHLGYVLFVLIAQMLILFGILLKWEWIRNFRFRIIHLTMILIVVVETVFNWTCPLTTLEDSLRNWAGEGRQAKSFIGRYLDEMLFYDPPKPPGVLDAWYYAVGGLSVGTFLIAPPRWRKKTGSTPGAEGPANDGAGASKG